MKDWVHPAVRRGSVWLKSEAIMVVAFGLFLVFLALQDPTVERLLWAVGGVVFAVFNRLPDKVANQEAPLRLSIRG